MLSGVQITCFMSCYAIVLLLEMSRFFFRSAIRGAVLSGFAIAGLIAHSAYIYHQQVAIQSGQILESFQSYFFIAAWGLVALYIFLSFLMPRTPFGLVLIPLVIGLIVFGCLPLESRRFSVEPQFSYITFWRAVHGVSFVLATVSVFIGFVFGIGYFEKDRQLKRKLPPRMNIKFPSLEWLSRASYGAIGVSLLVLGSGIFSGIILNRLVRGAEGNGVSLLDPMIIGTIIMFVFLLVFFLLLKCGKPSRESRRIAALTIAAFAFLLAILAFGLWFRGEHWQSEFVRKPDISAIALILTTKARRARRKESGKEYKSTQSVNAKKFPLRVFCSFCCVLRSFRLNRNNIRIKKFLRVLRAFVVNNDCAVVFVSNRGGVLR